MEKSGQPGNYPRMPVEMQDATHSGYVDQQLASPPSYEQATDGAPYPPVHVLSTPSAPGDAMNQSHQQQQQYIHTKATSGVGAQHAYDSNTQYGATNMGGGIPQQHQTFVSNVSGASQPMVQQPYVIVQQHAILPLGPEPAMVTCPGCHTMKRTRIDFEPSAKTHLMAAILCFLGLWCCVCVPYCAESCMRANHYCGNCNKFLGTYNGGGF